MSGTYPSRQTKWCQGLDSRSNQSVWKLLVDPLNSSYAESSLMDLRFISMYCRQEGRVV